MRSYAPRTLPDERPEDFAGEAPWWRWLHPHEVWEPEGAMCDCGEKAAVLARAGFETWMFCESCGMDAGVFETRQAPRGR